VQMDAQSAGRIYLKRIFLETSWSSGRNLNPEVFPVLADDRPAFGQYSFAFLGI